MTTESCVFESSENRETRCGYRVSDQSEGTAGLEFFNDFVNSQCRYLTYLFDEKVYENEYLPIDSSAGKIRESNSSLR